MYRYEIDGKNAVRVFAEGSDVPFLFQPDYPNGDAWTKKQAKEWAEIYIASLTDPTAPLPGPSVAEPSVPRPEIVSEPTVENPEGVL